jgi:hypothetical protein
MVSIKGIGAPDFTSFLASYSYTKGRGETAKKFMENFEISRHKESQEAFCFVDRKFRETLRATNSVIA